MRILVAGASGWIGSKLVRFLEADGHAVVPLSRGGSLPTWDPAAGKLEAAPIEGFDAVIHLGGESIASGRWTDARKGRIRTSRVDSTRLLATTIAGLASRPKILIVASATGFYGDRGAAELDESSLPGQGFLPDVCRDWEAAAEPARRAGIRTVHTRFGIVLGDDGGALARMLTPFKLCVGGRIGPGTQYWSWIAIDDVLGGVLHVLKTGSLAGPVNFTAPEPPTNLEFTKTLGRVLRRPTIFPMPAFAARLLMGEMADALLLASARVNPTQLLKSRFEYRCPRLEEALRHVLGQPAA